MASGGTAGAHVTRSEQISHTALARASVRDTMPTVTFISHTGGRTSVHAREGMSLVEVALLNEIEGIEAKCRGNCACVTCHVHIHPRWATVIGRPLAMEESMLDFAEDVDAGSRLACQVRLTNACDGMEVAVPEQQRTLGL